MLRLVEEVDNAEAEKDAYHVSCLSMCRFCMIVYDALLEADSWDRVCDGYRTSTEQGYKARSG